MMALKWLFVGRYRPRIEPLWSHFVRRTEFVIALYETVHDIFEGIRELAAYIVPEGKKEAVDLAEVYRLLNERLPNYIIPQYGLVPAKLS